MRKSLPWVFIGLLLMSIAQGYTPNVEIFETVFGEVIVDRRFNPFDGGVCSATARVLPVSSGSPFTSTFRIAESQGERSLSVGILYPGSIWDGPEEDAVLLVYINEEIIEIAGSAHTRNTGVFNTARAFYTTDLLLLSITSDTHIQLQSEVGPLTSILQHELIEAAFKYFDIGCSNNPFFETD